MEIRSSPAVLVAATALSLAACGRGDRIPMTPSGTTPGTVAVESSTQAATGDNRAGMTGPSIDLGGITTGQAVALDTAAEGGQVEVEFALDPASDPAAGAFAPMRLDDHAEADDWLRQISTGHGAAHPAVPPDAK